MSSQKEQFPTEEQLKDYIIVKTVAAQEWGRRGDIPKVKEIVHAGATIEEGLALANLQSPVHQVTTRLGFMVGVGRIAGGVAVAEAIMGPLGFMAYRFWADHNDPGAEARKEAARLLAEQQALADQKRAQEEAATKVQQALTEQRQWEAQNLMQFNKLTPYSYQKWRVQLLKFDPKVQFIDDPLGAVEQLGLGDTISISGDTDIGPVSYIDSNKRLRTKIRVTLDEGTSDTPEIDQDFLLPVQPTYGDRYILNFVTPDLSKNRDLYLQSVNSNQGTIYQVRQVKRIH